MGDSLRIARINDAASRAWLHSSSRFFQLRSMGRRARASGQRLEVLLLFKDAAQLACAPKVDLSHAFSANLTLPQNWRAGARASERLSKPDIAPARRLADCHRAAVERLATCFFDTSPAAIKAFKHADDSLLPLVRIQRRTPEPSGSC